jgi:thioredoxin-like negative regulator of GroEL
MIRSATWSSLILAASFATSGCDLSPRSEGPTGPAQVPGIPTSLSAGELICESDYLSALERAERQGLPVMVVFAHPESRNCYELAEEGFRHQKVVTLSKRFVCVVVDVQKQAELCRQLDVSRFPTVQFLSSTGRPLNRFVGNRPAHEVALEMQHALQALARRVDLQSEPLLR